MSRAGQGPAIDYHLCLLHKPRNSDVIQRFFEDSAVDILWSDIGVLETTLYRIERQDRPQLHIPNQSTFTNKPSTFSIAIENDPEWQNAYSGWQESLSRYREMKRKCSLFDSYEAESFEAPTIDTNSQIMETQSATDTQKPLNKEFTSRDFLLSIAGTFFSGSEDTSENVKSMVADILLRKYGTRDL